MLEAHNATVAFGRHIAVAEASLLVPAGEVLALCGPNGAGKSTLLAVLTGDLAPTSGSADLDERAVRSYAPGVLATRRAVLEQSPSLSASFTVGELVALPIRRDISPSRTRAIVGDSLHSVGLGHRAHDRTDKLSGGQRHRAHLARVLAQLATMPDGATRYLMLDEPTASLDLAHQIVAMQVARRVAAEGAGVLVVLHDLNLAAAYANRVALMEEGRIVMTAPPAEVFTPERLSAVYGTEIIVEQGSCGTLRIAPIYRQAA